MTCCLFQVKKRKETEEDAHFHSIELHQHIANICAVDVWRIVILIVDIHVHWEKLFIDGPIGLHHTHHHHAVHLPLLPVNWPRHQQLRGGVIHLKWHRFICRVEAKFLFININIARGSHSPYLEEVVEESSEKEGFCRFGPGSFGLHQKCP